MLGITAFACIAQQLPSLYMHRWVICLTNGNDAELNRQFPFGIDLNKILPDLLQLKTKAEALGMEISQHVNVNGSKAQSGSKLNYALD